MTEPLRVAYLQKAPSGHANACLRALADTGVDLLATVPAPSASAPFDQGSFDWIPSQIPMNDGLVRDDLLEQLKRFDPHALLVVSWDVRSYRLCASALRGRTIRVLCMDNQWLRTPRQVLGIATRPLYVQRCFDRVFLPGERQERFARKLGFAAAEIDRGFYSADVERFTGIPPLEDDDRRAFLFVGRLVQSKGIDVLTDAYARYRSEVDDPWDLVVAGTGVLPPGLASLEGVHALGFVQPGELPGLFARASALVLPSRFEPWGVVVHEAVCAGLLVLTTDRVGAADDLVEHETSGYIAPAGSTDRFLDALRWAHRLSSGERSVASSEGIRLSTRFSPQRWADTVVSMARGST